MGSSMLIGFNNDVEYKGHMFHIQTEDHGIKDGHITTIIFFSGQILDSKKISYQEDVKEIDDKEEQKKAIKKRMVGIHREFYKRLFDGSYTARVEQIAAGKVSGSIPATDVAPKGGGAAPSKLGALAPKSPSKSLKAIPKGLSKSGTLAPKNPSRSSKSISKGLSKPSTLSQKVRGKSGTLTPKAVIPKPPPLPHGEADDLSSVSLGTIPGEREAFRGLVWPASDMRIDGLVAEFLDSVA